MEEPESELAPDVYLVAAGDQAEKEIFQLAHILRQDGFVVERGFGGGNLKNRMKKADKSGAMFAIIIGDNEIANGSATVKDLGKGTQKEVSLDEISSILENDLMAYMDEESI
jgi:histidyl-tRNA synthetase